MFDMDGTLIDTHGLIAEQMASAFAVAGFAAPEPAAVQHVIGLSLPVAIGRLAGTDDSTVIDRLVTSYKDHYRGSLAREPGREGLYPGAREAVERLHARAGNLLGIATGKGLAGVNRILAQHAIADRFVTLQTPDHNPSKPHPGMLLRAMSETGAAPHEVVMIGDTSFDMELAKSAGARAIAVGWGYHEREALLQAGADILIESFAEIDAAIAAVLE